MKDVFGFKKNKCKVKLPDIHSFSCYVNNDIYANYIREKEDYDYTEVGFSSNVYIPAKGFDTWERSFDCDIPLDKLANYTAVASLSVSPEDALRYIPVVVIATVEINTNTEGYGTPWFAISVYNPTNFDMVFDDTHKLNITLIENV